MLLIRLKKATDEHKCSRTKKCKRMVKYRYGDEYFCKRHRPRKQAIKIQNLDNSSRCIRWRDKQKTVTARIMKLRDNATFEEKLFRKKLLKACPVKFKFQAGFIKHGYYAIVDFYIPSRSICIEIDGDYHNKPEQRRKDDYRDNWLMEKRGMKKIIRIPNERAKTITVDEIKKLIDVKYARGRTAIE